MQKLFNPIDVAWSTPDVVARRCILGKDTYGGGGATRPLPRDGGVEELQGDPKVGPHPKVWTRGQKWKK